MVWEPFVQQRLGSRGRESRDGLLLQFEFPKVSASEILVAFKTKVNRPLIIHFYRSAIKKTRTMDIAVMANVKRGTK